MIFPPLKMFGQARAHPALFVMIAQSTLGWVTGFKEQQALKKWN